MDAAILLPDPDQLRLEYIISDEAVITLAVRTTSATAACRLCGRLSARVHSRYRRTLADLPWHGIPVQLHLPKGYWPSIGLLLLVHRETLAG